MRQTFLNGIETRLAAGSLALAGLLLFTGCAASMKGTLETPVLTPDGGSFSSAQSVTVSDTTPGAALHCTTDGSKPTATSPVCAAPVIVYKSETLSAIAVAADGTTSSPVSATFTIALPAAATPVISLAAGTYTSAQTVTISDATTGATIYYTTDGSAPTTASTVYGGPITVTASETINAVAVSPATTLSATATAAFTINYPAATPAISPAAGTYTSVQSVSIADATAGASIYYTTDGSMPAVTAAELYSGPISLSQSGTYTINAIAIAPGSSVSAAASAVFTLNLTAATPVITPDGGTFTAAQTVTITDTTPGAVIHYSTTGTATANSPVYSGAITVSNNGATTVSAIAVAAGYANSPVATAAFTLNLPGAPAPVFSPAAGTYTTIQSVAISDTASGAAIYYTIDGSTPTVSSTPYTAPISVAATETIKAIATAPGYSTSAVATSVYTINLPAAATPVVSPAGGTFASAQTVTITDATPGATIYYTLNGSTPSASSTPYTAPFTVSATETVEAIAVATGYKPSAVATSVFTFNQAAAATPAISPNGGTFTTPQSVTMTDATAGAAIYYTTDGSTPSTNSTKYTGAITVSATETIKAVASAAGFNLSAIATASFTINRTAATPVISPAGGTFGAPTAVTISDATTGASIYYTTNGHMPVAGQSGTTLYAGQFTVSSSETVEAIAVATGYTNSAVASATFNITAITGIPLNGVVQSGSKPIAGASVQLYAAGTTGYGSAPTALLTSPVTTGPTGSFALGYTCPAAPGDQLYLVATGGGIGGAANSDIALMTALGSCAGLASGASFTINEVTTIGSVYALAAFAKTYAGGGIEVGTIAPSATCVSTGKETCNYTGLVNAFKTVNNLVNTTTGAALTVTPFYKAAGNVANLNTSTVPQARINTLADIVASCVEAGSSCSTLFTKATPPAIPPSTTAGTPPADTLQAALDIAQNPGNNVAALYALLQTPATEPYSPSLNDAAVQLGTCTAAPCPAPTDYTLALTFTGAGLSTAPGAVVTNTSMEIDAESNIIVTGYNSTTAPIPASSNMLAKFDSLGEGLTPATTRTAGGVTTYGGFNLDSNFDFGMPKALAIDQSGQVWVDNPANLRAYMQTPSSFVSTSININVPYSGSGNDQSNITIDDSGNAWLANGGQLTLVTSAGAKELSSNGSINSGPPYVFINHVTFSSDSSALWASDKQAGGAIYQINPADGTITVDFAHSAAGSTSVNFTPLVADGAANIYGCATSATTLNVFNRVDNKVVAASHPIANGRGCGSGPMIIDGQGHIFAVNYVTIPSGTDSNGDNINLSAGTLDEFTEQGGLITPAQYGYVGTTYEEPVVLEPAKYGSAAGLGIDGSGNLWAVNPQISQVANVPGGVLVEYVGIAAPVVTPISVALKNGELAARP